LKPLLLLLFVNTSWAEHWPIPSSVGGVLQNLDRPAVRPTASPTAQPLPTAKSELHITITAQSRPDVTVICRMRGEFFNHDLPGARPDPARPGSECAQVAGEKGTERIEDTRTQEPRSVRPRPTRSGPRR
jgi:hypothetical protein